MDYGSQQVLDQLTKRLQALEADHAALRANLLEHFGDLHAHILLMEGQDELAQFFLRRHDLFFGLVSDLLVEYDILDALVQ